MNDEEINEAIARHVMGYIISEDVMCKRIGLVVYVSYVPDYCNDLNAAFEAWEKLTENAILPEIEFCRVGKEEPNVFSATIPASRSSDNKAFTAFDTNKARALCKAILEAKGLYEPI
jgi:hypothetical protein